MNMDKQIIKSLAACALVCGLSLTARAQLGSGWTSTTESYVIQTSSGATAVPNSSGGGTFTVPSGIKRAEFRYGNLSQSTTEQFQGLVVYNSMAGNRVNCKQTFGPDPSTPWQMLAFDKTLVVGSNPPGAFYDVESAASGKQPGLYPYTIGATAQINTIYNPAADTVDIYINGTHVRQDTETNGASAPNPGPHYNKIGAYVTGSGTGPAQVTWTNVAFWTGGTAPSGGGGSTFTITASAGSNGSISPSGSVTVSQGASQSFSITPNSGYTVASVTVDGSSVGAVASYTFSNVQANHTIGATFTTGTTKTFVITASAGSNGSISPSGSVNVNQGASQSFSITPSSGYAVASVTVDGSSAGAVASYTFSNVQANHTISATFTSSGGGGSVAAPAFSEPSGTYSGEVHVRITDTTTGASLYYTTDGSAPTASSTPVPDHTIEFKSTTTLKAIAILNGATSSVTTATYTID
jgi:hypothetical protein